ASRLHAVWGGNCPARLADRRRRHQRVAASQAAGVPFEEAVGVAVPRGSIPRGGSTSQVVLRPPVARGGQGPPGAGAGSDPPRRVAPLGKVRGDRGVPTGRPRQPLLSWSYSAHRRDVRTSRPSVRLLHLRHALLYE